MRIDKDNNRISSIISNAKAQNYLKRDVLDDSFQRNFVAYKKRNHQKMNLDAVKTKDGNDSLTQGNDTVASGYSSFHGKVDSKKEHKERTLRMLIDRQNTIKAKVVDKQMPLIQEFAQK